MVMKYCRNFTLFSHYLPSCTSNTFLFPISVAKLDPAATAPLQIQVPQLNSVSFKQPKDTGAFNPYPNIEILFFLTLRAVF